MLQLRGSDLLEALSQTLNLGGKKAAPTLVQVRQVAGSAAHYTGDADRCGHSVYIPSAYECRSLKLECASGAYGLHTGWHIGSARLRTRLHAAPTLSWWGRHPDCNLALASQQLQRPVGRISAGAEEMRSAVLHPPQQAPLVPHARSAAGRDELARR